MKEIQPLSRREAKKREKLSRIETAARELFTEKGYEGTTTRAIAERADIGVGTLFLYFKEKRDLLVHIFQADIQQAVDRIFDDLPSIDGPERLTSVVGDALTRVFQVYETQPRLARVFAKEILFLDDEDQGKAWQSKLVNRLEALLSEARENKILPEDDGPPLSLHLFALHYHALVRWLGSAGNISPTQRDTELRAFVASALRP
ncbi:MAG: TetR/AcrR family transcriptional regulator [Myxococcota bacterium]